MTTQARVLPDDPYATLRALIRAQMTPEDRREFDAFVERISANARHVREGKSQ